MYIIFIITSASAFLFTVCHTLPHPPSNGGIKSSQGLRVVSLDAMYIAFEMSRV